MDAGLECNIGALTRSEIPDVLDVCHRQPPAIVLAQLKKCSARDLVCLDRVGLGIKGPSSTNLMPISRGIWSDARLINDNKTVAGRTLKLLDSRRAAQL